MKPDRDQVVHELAMACVNGMVQNEVVTENDNKILDIDTERLAKIAIDTYISAHKKIDYEFTLGDKE